MNKQEDEEEYKPYVIRSIILINLICFIVEAGIAHWQFAPMSENPTFGPSAHYLKLAGAKDTYRIRDGEAWRLFTPMFLHAGLIHLGLNMLSLRNSAMALEMDYGHWKILVVYLISGISSSLTSAVFLPRQIGVGASGAIFGVVGGHIADLILCWKYTDNRKAMVGSIAFFLVLGLGLGLLPIMDNYAHLGGLIGGFLISYIFFGRKEYNSQHTNKFRVVFGVLLVAYLSMLIVLLSKGIDGQEWCPACKVFGCVPSPWWSCAQPACIMTLNGKSTEVDWSYCDQQL
jgi:membrane associated rhomboid family serine protease